MSQKNISTKSHSNKKRGTLVYAFIDSPNLNLGTSKNIYKQKNKLSKIIIPNRHSKSSLLKKFHKYKVFLYREKQKLQPEVIKNGRRRS